MIARNPGTMRNGRPARLHRQNQAPDHRTPRRRDGDEDLLDRQSVGGFHEIPGVRHHRQAVHLGADEARVVVDESQGLEAQLGLGAHLPGQKPAGLAGADDEHAGRGFPWR